MLSSSVLQHLVLHKAVTICGGRDNLGRVLSVSGRDLKHWIDGERPTPVLVFNQAMKLVNDAYRRARTGI